VIIRLILLCQQPFGNNYSHRDRTQSNIYSNIDTIRNPLVEQGFSSRLGEWSLITFGKSELKTPMHASLGYLIPKQFRERYLWEIAA